MARWGWSDGARRAVHLHVAHFAQGRQELVKLAPARIRRQQPDVHAPPWLVLAAGRGRRRSGHLRWQGALSGRAPRGGSIGAGRGGPAAGHAAGRMDRRGAAGGVATGGSPHERRVRDRRLLQ